MKRTLLQACLLTGSMACMAQMPYTPSQPEGDVTLYSKNSHSYYVLWGFLQETFEKGLVMKSVEADNGKVYLNNQIASYNYTPENWLEFEKDENVLTFHGPQLLRGNLDTPTNCDYAMVFEFNKTTKEYLPTEKQEFSYRLTEDGMEPMDNNMIIGYGVLRPADENSAEDYYVWNGYGDCELRITRHTATTVEIPAKVNMENRYIVSADGVAHDIKLGRDGDKVYVQGIYKELPESAIVGTMNDGLVDFGHATYLGINTANNHYVYAMGGQVQPVWDENNQTYIDQVTSLLPSLEMEYDASTDLYSCVESMAFNSTSNELYELSLWKDPLLKICHHTPGVPPADPNTLRFITLDPGLGWGTYALRCKIPMIDVEDNVLDTSRLSYVYWLNGEEYTLTKDKYPMCPEDMTFIPFNYTENWWIYVVDEVSRLVYFFFEDYTTFGVQSVYQEEDGTELRSRIIYVGETGINEIASDTSDIISTAYYTLTGQRVINPSGLVIKVDTFSDGTRRSTKEIIQ
ncbi:MAG: hypothetical protein HDR88_07565 [Bacteroides sp.]|nr:hypothetical protein [Bacteroides sp.]